MTDVRAWRGLYAIVGPEHCAGRDPIAVAHAVLRGGCAVLQLRAKRLASAELRALAAELLAACRAAGTPFVLNDHVELALELGADGAHLGQTDMPLARARELTQGRLALGVSTHDLAQAHAAELGGADLIGFGPVFATATKVDADPVVGLHGLATTCSAVSIPVVAIGGLTLERASRVPASGAALGAAISAVCGAPDPERAARALHAALQRES